MTPQEARKALVAALRSGEYLQTVQQLKGSAQYMPDGTFIDQDNEKAEKTGYCCLGVACDLYQKENPDNSGWDEDVFKVQPTDHVPEREPLNTCTCDDCEGYYTSDTALPGPVRDWLGFEDENGAFRGDIVENSASLAGLNDSGHSFEFIARFIEENEKLLVEIGTPIEVS